MRKIGDVQGRVRMEIKDSRPVSPDFDSQTKGYALTIPCPQAGILTTVTASTHRPSLSTLPAALRRPACATVVLAALLFVTLATHYAGGTRAARLDVAVDSALNTVAPGPLHQLVWFGEPLMVLMLMLGLATVALVLGRRRLALLALVGPLLTGIVTTLVKPLTGRVTGDGDLCFPSGHTGAVTALGLVAALLVVNALRLGRLAATLTLLAGSLIPGGAMGVALVVNHWHYPTDTVGGFCAAVGMVLGSALVIERIADRRSQDPPGDQ